MNQPITFRQILMWILTPVLLLGTGIVYLWTQLGNAKRALLISKIDKELAETLAKREEAKKNANEAVSEWDKVRSNYFNDDGTPKQ